MNVKSILDQCEINVKSTSKCQIIIKYIFLVIICHLQSNNNITGFQNYQENPVTLFKGYNELSGDNDTPN